MNRASIRTRERFAGRKVSSLSDDERTRAHAEGYEPHGGNHDYFVGRDPRHMTQAELRGMQHEPMSPMAAIRAKCLDCCAGSPTEVRLCVAMACPNWPFRTGKNPWRAPPSDAQREASRKSAARLRSGAANAVRLTEENEEEVLG